jgi:hypothetical protein
LGISTLLTRRFCTFRGSLLRGTATCRHQDMSHKQCQQHHRTGGTCHTAVRLPCDTAAKCSCMDVKARLPSIDILLIAVVLLLLLLLLVVVLLLLDCPHCSPSHLHSFDNFLCTYLHRANCWHSPAEGGPCVLQPQNECLIRQALCCERTRHLY